MATPRRSSMASPRTPRSPYVNEEFRRPSIASPRTPRSPYVTEGLSRRPSMASPRSPRAPYVAEEVSVFEEDSTWDDFKLQAADIFDQVLRYLQIPFSVGVSALAMYWLIGTLISLAGPSICTFPGSPLLDICASRYTTGTPEETDSRDDIPAFDFASQFAKIERIAAKHHTLELKLVKLHDNFTELMSILTLEEDLQRRLEPTRQTYIHAAENAIVGISRWNEIIFQSGKDARIPFKRARNLLQLIKWGPEPAAGFVEKYILHVDRPGPEEGVTSVLSVLDKDISTILKKVLQRAEDALQTLPQAEDNMEKYVLLATGNLKPLKRERMTQQRYWDWRLRSLKNKHYNHLANFNWDASMASCAEYTNTIRESWQVIGETYKIVADLKSTLGGFKESYDKTPEKSEGGRPTDSVLDYYLVTLSKSFEILERAMGEAKELRK